MKYQQGPLRLGLPPRWRATSIADGVVVLHEESFRRGEDPGTLAESVTLWRLAQPADAESLPDYAESEMRRLVRQGEPEHSVDTLGDLEAQIYEWTDGATRVITWFVEPSRDAWYRIDYGTKDPEVTHSQLWERATAVLGDVEWRVPEARLMSSS